MLLFSSKSSSEPFSDEGMRKVSTWPLERPTVRRGSVGWTAWVNTSEFSGRVQRFSNMLKSSQLSLWTMIHHKKMIYSWEGRSEEGRCF